MRVPVFELGSVSTSRFLGMGTWGGSSHGSSTWVPASPHGRLALSAGLQGWARAAWASAGIWKMTNAWKICMCVCMFVYMYAPGF